MKIVFLNSCAADLDWFQEYYRDVFPSGSANAKDQYMRTKAVLRQNPRIGYPLEEFGLREFSIVRTPFSFIYRVTQKSIEVVRVWDQRADRPEKWARATQEHLS